MVSDGEANDIKSDKNDHEIFVNTDSSKENSKEEDKPQDTPKLQYGITSPVNTTPPTKADIAKSKEFVEYFLSLNVIEKKEDISTKLLILDKLNKLAKFWIVEFLKKKRMPEHDAIEVGGHIRTFGSYRLGVHTKGGDIDAVLIVPAHIQRSDFFDSFSTFLKSRSDVSKLRCVTEAYVPVMKFTFNEIEFDLLFCRIKRHKVPHDIDLSQNIVLQDMDAKDIRSINGFRVADEILSLVPSKKNFKVVLHAIKYWAKINELYSNILGFFGGITWAILVARLCQLYPCAAPSVLIYKHWDRHPILLKKIRYHPDGMTLIQWTSPANTSPKMRSTEQNQIMSIVTPTYPEQNTVHNVTLSTKEIIVKRLKKACTIAESIINNKNSWKDLFHSTNFFTIYSNYLVVSAISTDDTKLLEWHGFVESKLRLLILSLERNIFINIAHPHCKSYPALPSNENKFTRNWFVGLSIIKPGEIIDITGEEGTHLKIDLKPTTAWFTQELPQKCNLSFQFPGKSLRLTHVKRKDLSTYLDKEYLGQPSKRTLMAVKPPAKQFTTESLDNLCPIPPTKRKSDMNDDVPFINGHKNPKIQPKPDDPPSDPNGFDKLKE